MAVTAKSLHRIKRGDNMPEVRIIPPETEDKEAWVELHRIAWEILRSDQLKEIKEEGR